MSKLSWIAIAALASSSALAEEVRQLDAHVHGVGQLDIAIEDGEVTLMLRAPGADIVGFEYSPKSDEEKAAVEQALAHLNDPLTLFGPSIDADCSINSTEANLLFEGEGDEHAHDEHDHEEEHAHDEHDHEEEHAHDEHDHEDEHAHDDHAGSDKAGGHSEFEATFTLSCGNPAALDTLALTYFELFPNAQELKIQLITDAGGTATEATAEAATIGLR